MAGCEIITKNVDSPPSLSITIPKTSDLVRTSKRWKEVQLPIDILLLAVRDEDFLSCYYFLSEVVRSYKIRLGHVYFGNLGKDGGLKLKVGLITCSEGGGGDPGGPAMAVKNAVEILQPKAVFCIDTCRGLYRDKTKRGDVVVPAKLTTYAPRRMTSIGAVPCGFTTPLSSSMSRLIRQAGFGWKPPLANPEVREVTVHRDSELLSGPEQVESSQRRDEHIRLYPNAIAVELDGDGNLSVVPISPPYLQHREPMIETTNRMPENPMASPPLVLKKIGRRIKKCSGCRKPITSAVRGFSAEDDQYYCFGRLEGYIFWNTAIKSSMPNTATRHFHLNPVCTKVQGSAHFQIDSGEVEVSSSLRKLIKERFSKDI